MKKQMIEVITGPMFSGKTKTLIYKIEVAKGAGLSVLVVKPMIESRNSDEDNGIATHDLEKKSEAVVVSNAMHILRISKEYDVIAIDEAQFFDSYLYIVIKRLQDQGKWIIVAGLDMDYQREPFSTMANIMAIANKVNKLVTACNGCKEQAQYSYRKTRVCDTVYIGGEDSYSALCINCYNKLNNSNH
jgi:thymidine kinase